MGSWAEKEGRVGEGEAGGWGGWGGRSGGMGASECWVGDVIETYPGVGG